MWGRLLIILWAYGATCHLFPHQVRGYCLDRCLDLWVRGVNPLWYWPWGK